MNRMFSEPTSWDSRRQRWIAENSKAACRGLHRILFRELFDGSANAQRVGNRNTRGNERTSARRPQSGPRESLDEGYCLCQQTEGQPWYVATAVQCQGSWHCHRAQVPAPRHSFAFRVPNATVPISGHPHSRFSLRGKASGAPPPPHVHRLRRRGATAGYWLRMVEQVGQAPAGVEMFSQLPTALVAGRL